VPYKPRSDDGATRQKSPRHFVAVVATVLMPPLAYSVDDDDDDTALAWWEEAVCSCGSDWLRDVKDAGTEAPLGTPLRRPLDAMGLEQHRV
jgi:hypothetical protein